LPGNDHIKWDANWAVNVRKHIHRGDADVTVVVEGTDSDCDPNHLLSYLSPFSFKPLRTFSDVIGSSYTRTPVAS
jgi:hypothetical protein